MRRGRWKGARVTEWPCAAVPQLSLALSTTTMPIAKPRPHPCLTPDPPRQLHRGVRERQHL